MIKFTVKNNPLYKLFSSNNETNLTMSLVESFSKGNLPAANFFFVSILIISLYKLPLGNLHLKLISSALELLKK